MLNLIQDCPPFQSCNEAGDVGTRSCESRSVIEAVVAIAAAAPNLLGQSGFAALTRPFPSESIEFDVRKGDQQVSQLLRFDSNYEAHKVFITRGELGGSFNQVRGREGVVGYPLDDFSGFAARTRSSVFLVMGVHNKDKWGAGDRRLAHTAGFRMDETTIPIASAALAQSIVNYLNVRRQP